MFQADFGKTLLYGILVAIPAIIVAGPLLAQTFKKIPASPMKEFVNTTPLPESELPGMGISILTALLPVLLIALATLGTTFLPEGNVIVPYLEFIGNPVIAMLIAVFVALFTLGLSRGKTMTAVMQTFADGVQGITMVTLIIAGAGALKEVLVDSGVSQYLADLLKNSSISPLILAWGIAALIRVCVGSATVAGLTAAGIVLPLIGQSDVSPELMVLAIGSGSLIMSHVNDSGFWLFKAYFNLSVQDTLKTWTVMETTVGVMGLLGVLMLNSLL
jgi:Gnt-I system high-affinity gluconate transporter